MSSSYCPAPVLRALLHALLDDEYALYAATQNASRDSTAADRALLEDQARNLDSQLTRLAWQLGAWGEDVRIGPVLTSRDRGNFAQEFRPEESPLLHHLRLLHAAILWQVHRFTARTSQLGDAALDELLADLRAVHTAAIAALRQQVVTPALS